MCSTACFTERAPGLPSRTSSSTWVGRRRAIANSLATNTPFARTSSSATMSSNAISILVLRMAGVIVPRTFRKPEPRRNAHLARRRGSHHRHGLEDRVPGRPGGRGGRHAPDPRVHEDGDAGRGGGRRKGEGDRLLRGPVGVRGRHARRPRVTDKLQLDEPAEGVARLTISNPERRGALDHEILDALAERARMLEARCLVIRGSGDIFSAGYDIGNLSEQEFEESAEKLVAHPFHDALGALEAYRYPVVAEIKGHAIGGGLELAITCDIRLAARGVKMGMPPAKLGLIYSHTGLAKFIDVCGPANTAELFFVGRNVDSERAREMGLVNEVVDPDALPA